MAYSSNRTGSTSVVGKKKTGASNSGFDVMDQTLNNISTFANSLGKGAPKSTWSPKSSSYTKPETMPKTSDGGVKGGLTGAKLPYTGAAKKPEKSVFEPTGYYGKAADLMGSVIDQENEQLEKAYLTGTVPETPLARGIYARDAKASEDAYVASLTPAGKAGYNYKKAQDDYNAIKASDEYKGLESELNALTMNELGGSARANEIRQRQEEMTADAWSKVVSAQREYTRAEDDEKRGSLLEMDISGYGKDANTDAYDACLSAVNDAQKQYDLWEDDKNRQNEAQRENIIASFGGEVDEETINILLADMDVNKTENPYTGALAEAKGALADAEGKLTPEQKASYSKDNRDTSEVERAMDLQKIAQFVKKYANVDGGNDPIATIIGWNTDDTTGFFEGLFGGGSEDSKPDMHTMDILWRLFSTEIKEASPESQVYEEGKTLYSLVSDEEKQTLLNIISTGDVEAVTQYVDALDRECMRRQTLEDQIGTQEWASYHPALATINSIGLHSQVGKLVDYGVGLVSSASGKSFAAREYNARVTRNCETAVGTVASNIAIQNPDSFTLFGKKHTTGELLAFLYQNVVSMGESAQRMWLGPLGLILGGAGAGSSKLLECYKRGCTTGQAAILSLFAFGAEIITEKVSLEALFSHKTGANLAQNIWEVVKQAITEGSEEVASDLINEFADWWIMQDQNQVLQDAKQYAEENNISVDDAIWHVLLSGWGESFAGGALSGFFFGAAEQTGSVIQKEGWENVNFYQTNYAIDPDLHAQWTQDIMSFGLDKGTQDFFIDFIDSIAEDPSLLATKKGMASLDEIAGVIESVKEAKARAVDEKAKATKLEAAIDYEVESEKAQEEAASIADKTKIPKSQRRAKRAAKMRANLQKSIREVFDSAHSRAQQRQEMRLKRAAADQEHAHAVALNAANFKSLSEAAKAARENGDVAKQRELIAKMRTVLEDGKNIQAEYATESKIVDLEETKFKEETEAAISDLVEKSGEDYAAYKQAAEVTDYQIVEEIKGGNYESEQNNGTELYDDSTSEAGPEDSEEAGGSEEATGGAIREWGDAEKEESVAVARGFYRYTGGVRATMAPASTVSAYATAQAEKFHQKTGESVAFYTSKNGPDGTNINGHIYVKDGPTAGVTMFHELAEVITKKSAEAKAAVEEAVSGIDQGMIDRFVATYRNRNEEKASNISDEQIIDEIAPDIYGIVNDGQYDPALLFATKDELNAMTDEETKQFTKTVSETIAPIIEAYETANTSTSEPVATSPELETITEASKADPKVYEPGETIDPSDTGLSYVSFANGLGYETRGKERKMYREDGTEVTHVTADDVRKTPIGALINVAYEHGDIDEIEAERQYELFAGIGNVMLKTGGDVGNFAMSQQFIGAVAFTAMKLNSDKQYGTTYDFVSICTKTQAMIDKMSARMVEKGRALRADEILAAYQKTFDEGLPVNCPECYVFTRWLGVGSLLDNLSTYQDRYCNMTPEEVLEIYNDTLKEVMDQAKENGLTRGKAKGKAADKILEDLASAREAYGVAVEKGDVKKQKELEKKIKKLEVMEDSCNSLVWIEKVYFGGDGSMKGANPKMNSKAYVPKDILFDLNRSGEFAEQHPEAWGFRTTQGAGYGKAITPYADARVGESIHVTNSNSYIKSVAAGTANNLFSDSKGRLSAKAKEVLEKARAKQLIQAWLGGQRWQSTSDARYENATDYLLASLDLQAMGGFAQSYTKVAEAVDMFATMGLFPNQSLMPKGDGFEDDGVTLADTDVGGMDPKKAFANREKYGSQETGIAGTITIGVSDKHIRALIRSYLRDFVIPYHASGGKVDVISAMRNVQDKDAKTTGKKSYDYTRVQSEKVLSDDALRYLYVYEQGMNEDEAKAKIAEVKKNREMRLWILLKGKPKANQRNGVKNHPELLDPKTGNKFLIRLKDRINNGIWEEMGPLPKGKVEEQIFPNEYWDESVDYAHSGQITKDYLDYCESLGILPKFAGRVVRGTKEFKDDRGNAFTIKLAPVYYSYEDENGKTIRVPYQNLAYQYDDDGNITGQIEEYFWKLLTDRRMYDNEGKYVPQRRVTLRGVNDEMVTSFAKVGEGARQYKEPLSKLKARAYAKASDEDIAEAYGRATTKKAGTIMEQTLNGAGFSTVAPGADVQDAEYMKAVDSGDEVTARKIVDYAARSKGYIPVTRYHQTGKQFTEFDTSNPDAGKYDAQTPNGIFLKTNDHDIGVGGDWVNTGKGGDIQMPLYIKDGNMLRFPNREAAVSWYKENIPGYAELYDEMKAKLKEIDAEAEEVEDLYYYQEAISEEEFNKRWEEIVHGRMRETENEYSEQLRGMLDDYFISGKSGYDGIELDYDGHRYVNGKRENVHTFIVFDNRNVKSSETITRDEAGNIIPPSQRFDDTKTNINFSLVAPVNEDLMSETLNGTGFGYTPHGTVKPAGSKVAQAASKAAKQASMKTYEADLAAQMADMSAEASRHRGELEAERNRSYRAQERMQGKLDTQAQRAEQRLAREQERTERVRQTMTERLGTQAQRNEQMLQRQDQKALARQMGDERTKLDRERRDNENKLMRTMKVAEVAARAEYRYERHKAQKRAKNIDDIKTGVLELSKWSNSPNGKTGKSVPTFMKGMVDGLMASIDFGTENTTYKNGNPIVPSKQTKTWREAIHDLKSSIEHYQTLPESERFVGSAFDEMPEWFKTTLTALDESLSARKVNYVRDMNEQELEDCKAVVGLVTAAVKTANQLHANARYKTIQDAGEELIDLSKTRKRKRESDVSIVNAADKMVNESMLSSFDYFRRLGNVGKSISKSLSKGFEKYFGNVRKVQSETTDALNATGTTERDINEWNDFKKSAHTFELASGEKVALTTGQLMELYALTRRQAAYDHLFGQGIMVSNLEGNQEYRNRTYEVTPEDVDAMLSELTDQQKELVERLQTIMSTTLSKMGNEVTQEQYMYDLYDEDYYWTMDVDGNSVKTDEPGKERAFNALLNAGFTNRLVKSSNALILGNAFDTFSNHAAQMAAYNGVALQVADLLRLTNYSTKDAEGKKVSNRNVKQALTDLMGSSGNDYIIKLIKDINGLSSGTSELELRNALVRNLKSAAVSAKLRVVIQQPTAIIRAMAMINPVYFAKQGNLAKNIKEMQEHSDLAFWKDQGNFDIGTGRSIYGMLFGDRTMKEKVVNTLNKPAGMADNFGWGQIWGAVKAEVAKQHPDVEVGSEEFFDLVNDRFSDVINNTQVIDTLLHRSQIMRSKDTGVKGFTAFMNEPIKTFNMISNAIVDVKNGEPGAKKRLATTVLSVAASTAVNAFVTALHDSLKKREPEEPLDELIWENWKEGVVDGLNPAGMIPVISQIKSIIDGYSADSMDMGAIEDVITSIKRVQKWAQDGFTSKTYTTYGMVSTMLKNVGNLLGLPVTGLLSSIETIANAIVPGALSSKKLDGNSEKRIALVQEAGVSQKTAKHYMDSASSFGSGKGSNADQALSILTFDDDGDGKPDWNDENYAMIASVLGLSYNPDKDGTFTDWAEDQTVAYLKRKRKGGQNEVSEEEFDRLYNIYDDYFEILGMDSDALPTYDSKTK